MSWECCDEEDLDVSRDDALANIVIGFFKELNHLLYQCWREKKGTFEL